MFCHQPASTFASTRGLASLLDFYSSALSLHTKAGNCAFLDIFMALLSANVCNKYFRTEEGRELSTVNRTGRRFLPSLQVRT